MLCIIQKWVKEMENKNNWNKVNVVFKLKSPLHIGYMPFKGSVVSPTRYYVPGRNFWGAITKRITEYLYKKPEGKDYKDIGTQIMENFRFSYFYLYDGKTIYFPCYTNNGLKYGGIPKAEFEHRFIGSIVSTEIEDKTRTAKDESLHEIEFINNRFKDEENENIKPVMIAGCIWIKKSSKIDGYNLEIKNEEIFLNNFNIISELTLGGESKYGFGDVLLDSINRVEFSNLAPFKWKNPEKIEIESDEPIVAHLKYDKNIKFKGDIELLTGRGYFNPKNTSEMSNNPGGIILTPEYYFTPGTVLELKTNTEFCINWAGIFLRVNTDDTG